MLTTIKTDAENESSAPLGSHEGGGPRGHGEIIPKAKAEHLASAAFKVKRDSGRSNDGGIEDEGVSHESKDVTVSLSAIKVHGMTGSSGKEEGSRGDGETSKDNYVKPANEVSRLRHSCCPTY